MPKGVYIRTEETKRKMGLAKRGKKCKPFTDEHRKNMSISRIGKKCKPYSEEARKNMSLAHIGKKLKPFSEEHKSKISIALTGKPLSEETKQKFSLIRKGKCVSDEAKRKMRISALSYIKNTRGNISPNIGKREKQLLDNQERIDGIIILRNCHLHQLGYIIDGYCLENNTVYEVYEKFHKRQVQKDLNRQKEIQAHLGCNFVIIWDIN